MMSKLNPLTILLVWFVITVVISLSSIYNSGEAPDGAQQSLTTIASFPYLFISGAFLIIISSWFFYNEWLRKNKWFWVLSLFILIPSIALITESTSPQYGFNKTSDIINGDTITQKIEYYNMKENIVRSIGFMKNSKKDSIWKTFSREGNIIKIQTYKNDTLISEK